MVKRSATECAGILDVYRKLQLLDEQIIGKGQAQARGVHSGIILTVKKFGFVFFVDVDLVGKAGLFGKIEVSVGGEGRNRGGE
jgi:hypothetical protein